MTDYFKTTALLYFCQNNIHYGMLTISAISLILKNDPLPMNQNATCNGFRAAITQAAGLVCTYLISSPTVSSSDTLTFRQLWMAGILIVSMTE